MQSLINHRLKFQEEVGKEKSTNHACHRLSLLKKTKERAYNFFKWKKKCCVWISSFRGCLKNRGCIVDAQGPDPAHSLMRVLYPVVLSDDGECILTCLCKDDFLIVMSLHGSSRGGRKRGQWVCPNVTRAKWRKRQLGAPLGLLPICWVITVLSGEKQHFRQQAWVGAAASASWRACPCGLRLLRRGGLGLPLSGAN